MANSEGRAGGMNFHPKQLQKEWKSKDAQTKAGSTVCEHLNEPFDCSICRGFRDGTSRV
jgi:hypothetical protein